MTRYDHNQSAKPLIQKEFDQSYDHLLTATAKALTPRY